MHIVRALHRVQREYRLKENSKFIETKAEELLPYFALGQEVDPDRISPVI